MKAERTIESRKAAHVDFCLNSKVESDLNWWDGLNFIHNSLPEINLDEIDTSIDFLGHKLSAPILIAGMTGGHDRGEAINRNLAAAAAEVGIAFGVGSQRPALEQAELTNSYSVVKETLPPMVLGNVGIPQFLQQGQKAPLPDDAIQDAMEMIGASHCCLHLNYLQEIVQPGGDHSSAGGKATLERLASKYPIIAKETGAGVNPQLLEWMESIGVKAVDVGGLSGTSWSGVEYHRAKEAGDNLREKLGALFWNWGIPTPAILLASKEINIPLIATGGLRSGLDLARAIASGAALGGFAIRLLEAGDDSKEAVVEELKLIISELRAAMFLVGAANVKQLQGTSLIVSPELSAWVASLEG